MTGTCPHCGYDLTGLDPRGNCPECGNGFSPSSVIQPGTFLIRFGKAILLGLVALAILVIGGLLALLADHKIGAITLTLVLAGLPAFGAFTYWWAQREEERERSERN